MKNFYMFLLAFSLALISCQGSHPAEEAADNDNPSGNSHAGDNLDEMKGNHANTPAEPPATEYPGSGRPDTVNTKSGTKVNKTQTN